MKNTKILLTAATVLLASSLYITGDFSSEKFSTSTREVQVTDGDTLDITTENGNTTVRLLGIDAPETYSSSSPEEFGMEDSLGNRDCLENWGEKATEFLENRVKNATVKIETDPAADMRGDYGRLLGYVKTGNSSSSVNLLLIEKGYARVYETRFSRREKFREAEKSAQRKDLGVWSCS